MKNEKNIVSYNMVGKLFYYIMIPFTLAVIIFDILLWLGKIKDIDSQFKLYFFHICTTFLILLTLHVLRLKLVFNYNKKTITFRSYIFITKTFSYDDIDSFEFLKIRGLDYGIAENLMIYTKNGKKIRIPIDWGACTKAQVSQKKDELIELLNRFPKL